MSRAPLVLATTLAAACSGDGEAPKAKPVDKADVVAQDAGIQHDAPPPLDPSGMHLDDYVPAAGRPAAKKAGRQVEIVLRSTPPGATVAVDGVNHGITPKVWAGETGEHEFTFTLPGHGLARYRFYVISTGVVHARLDPVATEPTNAGTPPPELVPPGVVAPSTIIQPVDGPRRPTAGVAPHVPPPVVIDAAPVPTAPEVDAVPSPVPPVTTPAVPPSGLGPQP